MVYGFLSHLSLAFASAVVCYCIDKKGEGGGAAITTLVPEGPAAAAGLRVGDTIMKLNGNALSDEDFNSQISSHKSGSKVAMTYMRGSWASIAIITVGVETL
jgi:S1-C subfamily serine protease